MNTRLGKVLFILTFIPYAAMLVSGLHGAVFGASFLFSTDYGFDGFVTGTFLAAIYMTVFVPVIPVCAVFHILCLMRKTVPFIKKIGIKAFAVICTLMCSAAAAVPLLCIYVL